MSNPFDILGPVPTKQEEPFEEIIGCALSCQERDCHEVLHSGKYYESETRLTWECKSGHHSEIEIVIEL